MHGGRTGCGSLRKSGDLSEAGFTHSMVGRGQAVRHGTLDPAYEGSNPSAPASLYTRPRRSLPGVVSYGSNRAEAVFWLRASVARAGNRGFSVCTDGAGTTS